jgi:RNA polymerase sigma factor (sigma-70 family)
MAFAAAFIPLAPLQRHGRRDVLGREGVEAKVAFWGRLSILPRPRTMPEGQLTARAQEDLDARDRRRAESDAVDRELVTKAQQGDRAALGELLHRHGPGLYRSVLLPRLGNEASAKEALSETYAKVVANIGKFVWQNVGFYPWLRTVALRVALDQLRAKKRLVLFEEDDLAREVDAAQTVTPVEQQVSDQRDREAARAKVEEALATINPRYARAIRLRVLDERPREEVAAELGVSASTFDVLLHRAVAALKKALAERGQTSEKDDE